MLRIIYIAFLLSIKWIFRVTKLDNHIINNIRKLDIFEIKFLQWYSLTIRDKEIRKIFESLHENCSIHSVEYNKKIINNVNDIMLTIEDEPIASGSIAQVYKGKYNNVDVAIKVIHPNLFNNIIKNYNKIKWFLNKIKSVMVIIGVGYTIPVDIDLLKNSIINELDFSNEARNIEIFGNLNRENGSVILPKCYFYNKEILVMNYIDGKHFNLIDESEKKEAIKILFLFVLDNLINNGIIHSDLHFGNWKYQKAIVLYDFGSICEVPKKNCKILLNLVLTDNILGIGSICVLRCKKQFSKKQIVNYVENIKTLKDSLVNGLDINEILFILSNNGIVLDSDIYLLLKNFIILEKLCYCYLFNKNIQRSTQLEKFLNDMKMYCFNYYKVPTYRKVIINKMLDNIIRGNDVMNRLTKYLKSIIEKIKRYCNIEINDCDIVLLFETFFVCSYHNGLNRKKIVDILESIDMMLNNDTTSARYAFMLNENIRNRTYYDLLMDLYNWITTDDFMEEIKNFNESSDKSFIIEYYKSIKNFYDYQTSEKY